MTAVSAALLPALASAAPWEIPMNIELPDGGRTSQKVELIDYDNDGFVDIVFANSQGEGAQAGDAEFNSLLHNDAGAGFTEVQGIFDEADHAWAIKAGDINNDGAADLVVGDNWNGQSYVLLNDGGGNFTSFDIPFSLNLDIGDLELGDVDRDGNLDIFATDWGDTQPHGPIFDKGGPLRLWLGKGDGTFTDGTSKISMGMEVKAAWSFDIELLDLNNDYWLDAIVSTKGDADFAIALLNDGEGNLVVHDAGSALKQGTDSKEVNVAFTPMDFDGDGYLDLLALQDGGVVMPCMGNPPVCQLRNSFYQNDKTGKFTSPPYWPNQHNPGKIDYDAATLDYNNDGLPDFVVTGLNADGVARIFVNNGTQFAPPSQGVLAFPNDPVLAGAVSLAFADFNNDKREDVAVAQRHQLQANHVLFGKDDPMDGVPVDSQAPRIYDDGNFGMKLPTLLYFGEDAGFDARVNDYKTPTHWHDFQHDTNLTSYNLTGIGADRTAHNRRLPYMEFALSLANPDDINKLDDTDPQKYIAPSIWFGEALWQTGFTVPYNGKPEDTLTWQYCAIDAAGNKTCLGPYSIKLEIDPNACGDGVVQQWEVCDDAVDELCVNCANTCGDGVCEDPENSQNCPEDCGPCDNDNVCEPPENEQNCPDDCDYGGFCGDDICQDPPENFENCPEDCNPCDNDNVCEPPENEQNCPDDCDYGGFCGDNICQDPPENEENCPQDCPGDGGPTTGGGQCGDGVCDPNENPQICPEDCPAVCGDGLCTHDETPMTCPQDCGDGNTDTLSGGECPDTASGGDQCQLDDDGCGCVANGNDTRSLWASLLLFGVFGIRRFRKRA